MSDANCGCGHETTARLERATLRTLLLINAAMFVVEAVAGWRGDSTGLLADSLDMLADALVYGVALFAVGAAARRQVRAAALSGAFQVALGVGVIGQVSWRAAHGSEPAGPLMIAVGLAALAANVACLRLIAKHRDGGVHMRASWIFSANDVIANAGVIVSGLLVELLDSRAPDLVVGLAVAALVVRGGVRILGEARRAALTPGEGA